MRYDGHGNQAKAKGKQMGTEITSEVRQKWKRAWYTAWNLMPDHSAKKLLTILGGYKVTPGENGHLACNGTVWNNYVRGSIPKSQEAQRKLKLLAGPYGATLLKAYAAGHGWELKNQNKWEPW